MSNSDKLSELLGYVPGTKPSATATLLEEVRVEKKKEREAAAKEQVRAILTEAEKLDEEMRKARKDFAAREVKHDKELGKLINSAARLLSGKEEPPPAPEAEGPVT